VDRVDEVCKVSFVVPEITHYSSLGFGLREMRYYFKHRTGLTTFCFTGPELFYVRQCEVTDSLKHRVYCTYSRV
jgi:hypothetical protein